MQQQAHQAQAQLAMQQQNWANQQRQAEQHQQNLQQHLSMWRRVTDRHLQQGAQEENQEPEKTKKDQG